MPRMAQPADIHFELMFHADPQAGPPSVATVERYRPDQGAVQAVRAWFGQHGIQSHDTGFSVAASAPAAVFERHFGQRADPKVPRALSKWIDRVILPPPPTLF